MSENATNSLRIDKTDRNIQAQPTTSDVGVDNSARMVDAYVDVKPSTTDAETNTTNFNNIDTEEQVSSREWIKGFYKKYPIWVALRIQPIRKKTGGEDPW
ncbi:uncharacterized protein PHALS_04960 [Plasmopara halstedii]|uniref:Uncharacterized protein n=1 Tax=Plasmopara halstedii TaxID=4781 RepID=A0A0P1AAF0_PLAHL|nr:uncharacterized protein PHALS_04960 [Plasmopara halstedii]CEG37365.1 hypothetical protein PHALS_04960 [Plasmopara halstedii]|eukprot:XP_024573734.1 hypothetical protein PHALS_04960 [Plasmopara halstedii]